MDVAWALYSEVDNHAVEQVVVVCGQAGGECGRGV